MPSHSGMLRRSRNGSMPSRSSVLRPSRNSMPRYRSSSGLKPTRNSVLRWSRSGPHPKKNGSSGDSQRSVAGKAMGGLRLRLFFLGSGLGNSRQARINPGWSAILKLSLAPHSFTNETSAKMGIFATGLVAEFCG